MGAAALAAAAGDAWQAYKQRVLDYAAGSPQGDYVPGDWVTGDRFLDMSLLPLLWAVGFVVLRNMLLKYVFQPAGFSVMTGRMKKTGRHWDAAQREEWMRKWNESSWKCFIYVLFTAWGFAVSVSEPWFTDSRDLWRGATRMPLDHVVPAKTNLLYTAEMGFYMQAIPFLMFIEVRRKDWAESFAHHVVTLGLLAYSAWANFMRAGVMVMLLHDVSDIFLEAAKLSRYAGRQSAATAWFVGFALSWIVLRVVIFPRVIVYSCLYHSVVLVALPYDIDPQPHWSILSTLFSVLYVLHIYWTYLILQVVWKQLVTGETRDVREEDDD